MHSGSLGTESRAGLGVLLQRREQGAKAEPNPAHRALAELEKQLGTASFFARKTWTTCTSGPGLCASCICTENWPRLVAKTSAAAAGRGSRNLPEPERGGPLRLRWLLRPHIVFFGEIPLEMDRIQKEIARASLMVVVGTSGSVYPAANFVHWAKQGGARTVYIGPERPLNASAFTHVVEAKPGSNAGLFQGM